MMNPAWIIAGLVAALGVGQPWVAFGQEKVDLGKREYDANCAVCHGTGGKGDGPFSGVGDWKQAAADLTTLARRNNGVFPFARVYEFIDGTQVVKAHGTREMPIWGADYRAKGAEYYMGTPFNPDLYARARIFALTEYVYRLQAK
jgi:mono/diheme cytochrome c family protein